MKKIGGKNPKREILIWSHHDAMILFRIISRISISIAKPFFTNHIPIIAYIFKYLCWLLYVIKNMIRSAIDFTFEWITNHLILLSSLVAIAIDSVTVHWVHKKNFIYIVSLESFSLTILPFHNVQKLYIASSCHCFPYELKEKRNNTMRRNKKRIFKRFPWALFEKLRMCSCLMLPIEILCDLQQWNFKMSL
jgi:hypothetical protein